MRNAIPLEEFAKIGFIKFYLFGKDICEKIIPNLRLGNFVCKQLGSTNYNLGILINQLIRYKNTGELDVSSFRFKL